MEIDLDDIRRVLPCGVSRDEMSEMRMPENSRSLRPCQAASDTKALEAAARAQLNRHKAYAEGCRFRKNSSKIPVATSHKLLCKRILHGRRIRLRPGAVPGQARLPFWTATHGPITPPGHPRSSSPAPVSTRPCAASKFRAETAGIKRNFGWQALETARFSGRRFEPICMRRLLAERQTCLPFGKTIFCEALCGIAPNRPPRARSRYRFQTALPQPSQSVPSP